MTATSDANGVYNFNALPPSNYTVTAEKDGFKKKTLDNYSPFAEQSNALNLELEAGGATETVTVSADLPAIDTETATVSGTVSSNQIQHMPPFGRDVLKLAQLAPGSFADGSQASGNDNYNLPGTQSGAGQSGGADGIFKTENGAQIIANGNQTENNGISIDGISTTSAVWGGATVITPSEDSVDSVKVVSNSSRLRQRTSSAPGCRAQLAQRSSVQRRPPDTCEGFRPPEHEGPWGKRQARIPG